VSESLMTTPESAGMSAEPAMSSKTVSTESMMIVMMMMMMMMMATKQTIKQSKYVSTFSPTFCHRNQCHRKNYHDQGKNNLKINRECY
jgi:hypothetical protein